MLKQPASLVIDPNMFRAYDIRGIAYQNLSEETVRLLGKALGTLVLLQGERQLVVERDGRESGPVLLKALTEGILSTGCDVIDLGMVPTPLLYYATHVFVEHSGVMLTGSHNPAEYNGLKMVVKGATLTDAAIKDLYRRINEQQFLIGEGHYYESEIVDRYINHLTRNIELEKPVKIVIDAGNGVTGMMAGNLYRALGCDVHELYCEVDGRFPNHHPDPSQPENLQALIAAVKEQKAAVGLAFDGDGDRLGVVTNEGEIIWPDRLLMLYAKAVLAERPNAKIIYDVKCTHHLDALVRDHDGQPLMWKTGHSLIKAKMAETKAELAGEMSGHFFFKDRWFGCDDALYAGARLLEILANHEQTSSELFAAIPNSINTPELKVFVEEAEKFNLMQLLIDKAMFNTATEVLSIDGLRVNFKDGWGLVRPSNTTPYLVMRFEAINQVMLENIQSLFKEWMLSVKPDLVLPF